MALKHDSIMLKATLFWVSMFAQEQNLKRQREIAKIIDVYRAQLCPDDLKIVGEALQRIVDKNFKLPPAV